MILEAPLPPPYKGTCFQTSSLQCVIPASYVSLRAHPQSGARAHPKPQQSLPARTQSLQRAQLLRTVRSESGLGFSREKAQVLVFARNVVLSGPRSESCPSFWKCWESSKCSVHCARLQDGGVAAWLGGSGPSLTSFEMSPRPREAHGFLSVQTGRESQNCANCLRFAGYTLKWSQIPSKPGHCHPRGSIWMGPMTAKHNAQGRN